MDAKGNVVPDAIIPLTFSIEGEGKIIATANANPSDMESFQQPKHKTFRGKALIIIQPKGKAGTARLRATGNGLKAHEIVHLYQMTRLLSSKQINLLIFIFKLIVSSQPTPGNFPVSLAADVDPLPEHRTPQ